MQVQTIDGFVNLNHSSFKSSLSFVKSIQGRKYHGGTAKFWSVPITTNQLISLAEKAGVWDSSLVEDVEEVEEVEDVDNRGDWEKWYNGFRLALLIRHKVNLSKFEISPETMAAFRAGFDNQWSVNEAADTLVEAGIFN